MLLGLLLPRWLHCSLSVLSCTGLCNSCVVATAPLLHPMPALRKNCNDVLCELSTCGAAWQRVAVCVAATGAMDDGNVKVGVRVRPLLDREVVEDARICVSHPKTNVVTVGKARVCWCVPLHCV